MKTKERIKHIISNYLALFRDYFALFQDSQIIPDNENNRYFDYFSFEIIKIMQFLRYFAVISLFQIISDYLVHYFKLFWIILDSGFWIILDYFGNLKDNRNTRYRLSEGYLAKPI